MQKLLLGLVVMVAGCTLDTATAPTPTRPQVVAFSATWCGPCRANAPGLAALERGGLAVRHVDIDDDPAEARRFHVRSIPLYVWLVDGREIRRTTDLKILQHWAAQ